MAQVDSSGRVHACALRIGRLDANGVPLAGTSNGYITNTFARLRKTPQIEAGAEVNPRDACGGVAFSYKGRDVTTRYNLEMDLLKPDPELLELLVSAPLLTASLGGRVVTDGATTSGSAIVTSATIAFTQADVGRTIAGTGIPGSTTIISVQGPTSATMSANATATATGVSVTITASATTVGNEAPELNVVPSDGGLSLEIWARAVTGSAQSSQLPWWRTAFPRTFWRLGDEEWANAEARPSLIGYAVENPAWGNGPWNDWKQIAGLPNPSTFTLSRAFGTYRTDAIPAIPQAGYVTTPAQV